MIKKNKRILKLLILEMEQEDIIIDLIKIRRVISESYEQLYANTLDNLNEMKTVLKRLLKLTQEEQKFQIYL